MDDHASRGRSLTESETADGLFPPRDIESELLEAGRLLFARECGFVAGAADSSALPAETRNIRPLNSRSSHRTRIVGDLKPSKARKNPTE